MRRTRSTTKTKTNPKAIDKQVQDIIEDAMLHIKAEEDYYDYALHVIEDRAIYAKIDGLKPVTRRLLWAAHNLGLSSTSKFIKAQRLGGETMGKYHPHGDAAIFGALVTAVNQYQNLFEGSGNWGTMVDPPAAPRYVECRLSKYADKIFFDKFYLNSVHYTPNYDDSDKEPLILPALLPNALINGNFGIAPGVRTQTPTFTLESVAKVLIAALKNGGVATPQICLDLEFVTEYGGAVRKTPTLKADKLAFFKSGKGRFLFDSQYTEDGKKNAVRIDRFAPIGNIDGVLTRTAALPGVLRVRDASSKNDRHNAYEVEFNKTTTGAAKAAVLKKVMDVFSGALSYNVQVVDRKPDPDKLYGFKQLNMSNVPEMLTHWIKYRISLERSACKFWIAKRDKEIEYLQLMRLAVKNRAFIIKALDKPLDDVGLAEYIAKGLKITVEQANQILDLKVRQLKALEDTKLVDKIETLEDEIESYEDRIARPKSFIAKQIVKLSKELA